jgi:hypothetical protein
LAMFFLVTYHWKVDKVEPFLKEIHELSPTKIGIFMNINVSWVLAGHGHRYIVSEVPANHRNPWGWSFSEHWKQSHYRTGK